MPSWPGRNTSGKCLTPCARPPAHIQKLMTVMFDKVKREATHASTKMYESNAYAWQGNTKGTHARAEDIQGRRKQTESGPANH